MNDSSKNAAPATAAAADGPLIRLAERVSRDVF
jgi:hypothetical protein